MNPKTADRVPAGHCQHCRLECGDKLGAQIYPERHDLAEVVVWVCPGCGARVGSHPDGKPLGTAADPALRRARVHVHGLLDPLWMRAIEEPEYAEARSISVDTLEGRKKRAIIKRTARKRVYEWLAAQMGLSYEDCHVSMMDIEECRAAYRALRGATYAEIRAWARARPKASSPTRSDPQPSERRS